MTKTRANGAPVEIKSWRYVDCPNGCKQNERFLVDHILDGANHDCGPWYCEVCGQGWLVTARAGVVYLDRLAPMLDYEAYGELVEAAGGVGRVRWDGRQRRCTVTLEIPPLDKPIRLHIKTHYLASVLDAETTDGLRDIYEEGCPTNWLCDVDEVEFDGDTDPHGLAKFISAHEGWTP